MSKKVFLPILIIFSAFLLSTVNAAPSGTIDQPVGTVADNVLVLGGGRR